MYNAVECFALWLRLKKNFWPRPFDVHYVRYLEEVLEIHVVDTRRVEVQKLATKIKIRLETVEFDGIDFPVDNEGITLYEVSRGKDLTSLIEVIGKPL